MAHVGDKEGVVVSRRRSPNELTQGKCRLGDHVRERRYSRSRKRFPPPRCQFENRDRTSTQQTHRAHRYLKAERP